MKKRMFLHIGLPKTGTTYLQCQIQFNRKQLKKNGIYVPQTGQLVGRDHNLLALALQPERWGQFSNNISRCLPSLWHDFLIEIDNCDCEIILVTSEAFSWEIKSSEQIKAIRNYLQNFDVKIVFCERDPYDFISSMYGHMIRTGRGPYALDAFLLEFTYFWSAAFQKKRWGEYFGDSNFVIISYEELKGDFIFEKFLNKLFDGHPVLSENFDSSPDINPNFSFSPRFLRFIEELSANHIDSTSYVNLYSKISNKIVPIETKMLQADDIDLAISRCGIKIYYTPSVESTETENDYEMKRQEQINSPLKEESKIPINTRQYLMKSIGQLYRKISELGSKQKCFVKSLPKITALWERLKNIFSKLSSEDMSHIGEIKQALKAIVKSAKINDERTKAIEHLVNQCINLASITEERSRTLEYIGRQSVNAVSHQIDQLQKIYVELMPTLLNFKQRATFNASNIVFLKTDYPIAENSNDNINPESTAEGISRPTFFVRDCIRVLGNDIKCLDLGSGAGGLVFEYVMNDVLAVGVEGSDFCCLNRIGYWPILPNNLFTCDITKPFSFLFRDTQIHMQFNVITMWEVLEHINETDLNILFDNITKHLDENGFFIGSISLVEYLDRNGNPYHLTLKSKDWWREKFNENGLRILDSHPFNQNYFCRGNGQRFQDFHNYNQNPDEGFWFVAKKIIR